MPGEHSIQSAFLYICCNLRKGMKKGRARAKTGTDSLVKQIVLGIQAKKGSDIVVLDLRSLKYASTDQFIICSASSDRQTQAIANEVEEKVREKLNEKPWHVEGLQAGEWILMDYVNVVVHIFLERSREFYKLEELWGDAPATRYE